MTDTLTIPQTYLFTDSEHAMLAKLLEVEITKCINMHGDVLDTERYETVKKMQHKVNVLSK